MAARDTDGVPTGLGSAPAAAPLTPTGLTSGRPVLEFILACAQMQVLGSPGCLCHSTALHSASPSGHFLFLLPSQASGL